MSERSSTRPRGEGGGTDAAQDAPVDEIRCKRLVIVNDAGDEVIKLELSDDGTAASVIVNSPNAPDAVAILSASTVYAANGTPLRSADLALFGEGQPTGISSIEGVRSTKLAIHTPDGEDLIVAKCTDEWAALTVCPPGHPNTNISMHAQSGTSVSVDDPEIGVVETSLYLSDRGETAAVLDSGGAYRPGGRLVLEDARADKTTTIVSGADRDDVAPAGGCDGRCYYLSWMPGRNTPERRAWHDELIHQLDNFDLPAAVWLIEEMELSNDGENDTAQHPWGLTEFTEQHNWSDPVRVQTLANFIELWAEGQRCREALHLVCKRTGIPFEHAYRDMVAADRAEAGA